MARNRREGINALRGLGDAEAGGDFGGRGVVGITALVGRQDNGSRSGQSHRIATDRCRAALDGDCNRERGTSRRGGDTHRRPVAIGLARDRHERCDRVARLGDHHRVGEAHRRVPVGVAGL